MKISPRTGLTRQVSPSAWARSAALVMAAVFAGAGCTVDPVQHADAIGESAHMRREQIAAGAFVLTGYLKLEKPGAPLRVYIEGDGLAWISRTQPSLDPSPLQATGLKLAAADAAPNVAYLARPCQFTPMAMNPNCAIPYWTSKRFAPEVVTSMNDAVNTLKARARAPSIEFIGYSGGAALAVLLAARRNDVASIRTVAGNLDDEFVNRLHHVSSMPESENPIDFASRVASIPQVHFNGADDTVVPHSVTQRFIAATGPRCAQARTVAGMSHDGDWSAVWPRLLAVVPECGPHGRISPDGTQGGR